MPSTAPRTVAVAATTVGVVAAAGASAAAAPASTTADAAPVPAADAVPSAPAADTAASAPAATGAVPIPARVAAYTAAYAAAAAAVVRHQPAVRASPRLTPEEKEVVLNVHQYVTRTWPETRNSYRECTEKIAEITGLAKTEVYRFIRGRRLARPLEAPRNMAIAWERMYRYYHEMENGVYRPENFDFDKDLVLPDHCMWILNRIIRQLNRRRRSSSSETSTDPDE